MVSVAFLGRNDVVRGSGGRNPWGKDERWTEKETFVHRDLKTTPS